jgi:hypothetical protein
MALRCNTKLAWRFMRKGAGVRVVLVNFKVSNIFKGIFEMQNSTRNGKNFAKMRALGT